MLDQELAQFADELDQAIYAHSEWSYRIVCCAILKTSPGEDALNEHAHKLCHLGQWLDSKQYHFELFGPEKLKSLADSHLKMHQVIRSICTRILNNEPGSIEELEEFKATQTSVIDKLTDFKTLVTTRISQFDALTRLPLRHFMEKDYAWFQQVEQRVGNVIGLIIIDIDFFKKVNDQHGHNAGDIVLRKFAETLEGTLRKSERVYRYGGEEFLLMVGVDGRAPIEDMQLIATRILNEIRELSITLPSGKTISINATMGIAISTGDDSLKDLIARADSALYKGKNTGRDCFVVYTPS